MNNSFDFIFKCKLCGDKIIDNSVDISDITDYTDYHHTKDKKKVMYLVHKCKDGNEGILEHVGFVGVEE